MILWIDAQLSPYPAPWISSEYGVKAQAVRDLGLREADAIVPTKDRDFDLLLELLSPPPQVLWITIGNTSSAHLRKVLSKSRSAAFDLLCRGEPLVEIADKT